jgi:hypothetical protein
MLIFNKILSMTRTSLFLTLLIGIVLTACNSNSKQDVTSVSEGQTDSLTEYITKTYSVMEVNGEVEKDTLNLMQSEVIDGSGKKIRVKNYNNQGVLLSENVFLYDESGKKTGANYFRDGVNTVYFKYELDSLGREIGYEAYDKQADTLLYEGAMYYENEGRIRKDGYYIEDDFVWNFEYKLDDEGNEVGYVYIDPTTGIHHATVYRYTRYNEDGEWVERQILEDGFIVSVQTREIKPISKENE